MKKNLLVILLGAIFLIPTHQASACFCDSKNYQENLLEASNVFVGEISEIQEVGDRVHKEIHFESVVPIKGDEIDRVQTTLSTASCGLYDTKVGQVWVVFAVEREQLNDGVHAASYCLGSTVSNLSIDGWRSILEFTKRRGIV